MRGQSKSCQEANPQLVGASFSPLQQCCQVRGFRLVDICADWITCMYWLTLSLQHCHHHYHHQWWDIFNWCKNINSAKMFTRPTYTKFLTIHIEVWFLRDLYRAQHIFLYVNLHKALPSGCQHLPPAGGTEEWVAQQLQRAGLGPTLGCSYCAGSPLFSTAHMIPIFKLPYMGFINPRRIQTMGSPCDRKRPVGGPGTWFAS